MPENEMKYNLAPLWNEIMKVYAEFRKVCERHGLRHYVAYGTAIGAVRHGNFIPWDDDFDVLMPRPDYEKFVDLAPDELPSSMQVMSWRVQHDYHHVFNKVRLMDDAVVERVKQESGLNIDEGIYIDMFPIDGAPSSSLGRCFYWLNRWSYRALGVYLSTEKCSLKRFPLHLLGFIRHLFHKDVRTSDDAMRLMDKWFRTYEFEVNGYSLYAAEDFVFYPPGSFGKPVMRKYGNWGEVPLPSLYDSVLRAQFGDYMNLPPVEMRMPKHQILKRD